MARWLAGQLSATLASHIFKVLGYYAAYPSMVGTLLEPFWGLGGSLDGLWASWAVSERLGAPRGGLGASRGYLGVSWGVLG